MVTLDAMLKIYFELFLLNQKAYRLETWLEVLKGLVDKKKTKFVLIGNPQWHHGRRLKNYYELIFFNQKANWLETCPVIRWAIQGPLFFLIMFKFKRYFKQKWNLLNHFNLNLRRISITV